MIGASSTTFNWVAFAWTPARVLPPSSTDRSAASASSSGGRTSLVLFLRLLFSATSSLILTDFSGVRVFSASTMLLCGANASLTRFFFPERCIFLACGVSSGSDESASVYVVSVRVRVGRGIKSGLNDALRSRVVHGLFVRNLTEMPIFPLSPNYNFHILISPST